MIAVTYKRVGGVVVADGEVGGYVRSLLSVNGNYNSSFANIDITVSSNLIVDRLRLAVKEGDLDHNDLVFKFEGREITVDNNGRLLSWPEGFCDTWDNILYRML